VCAIALSGEQLCSRLNESLLSASLARGSGYRRFGILDGRKEQTVPVMLFPVPGILEVFVLPLLLFKFRVMTLPGSVPFVGRDKLVAHFMINSEFQNTQGYKVLLQPRMNPDEFFSLIVGEPQPANTFPRAMESVINELLMSALAFDGTIEYCHGVGLKLSHLIHEEQGTKKAVLTLLKQSLDPHNVLNPGKLGYSYPGDLHHS